MLRLSKKLLFAIEAVVDIAYHSGSEPVRSNEISRRQGIPRRYLEQVLQQLVHHGVLSGQRGPRGGYRLARERRRITVGEIIRIVRQLEGTPDPASEMMQRFDSMTIEELCERAREKGVTSEASQVPDFSI